MRFATLNQIKNCIGNSAAADPFSNRLNLQNNVLDSVVAIPYGTVPNYFVIRNSLAAWKFTTYDSEIWIDVACKNASGTGVGVLVNGSWFASLTVPADSVVRTMPVALGSLGVQKVVEVWAGNQSTNAPNDGTFVAAIRGNVEAIRPLPDLRAVVYGDSISSGYFGTVNERNGYVSLMRLDYPGRVSVEASAGRALLLDPLTITELADRLTALLFDAPGRDIWLAIGTNDWGFNQSLAGFQAAYLSLLTQLRTLNPSANIYAQSPIVRLNESVPNAGGNTLGNFRTAIATAAAAVSNVTYVDGLPFMTLADTTDGTHPNDTGFVKYKTAVKAAIGY
jgi:lysophospholipase L1-like esterase